MFHLVVPAGLRLFCLACLFLLLPSCTSLLTSTVIEPTVGNLQMQTDLDLVCEGGPAYLLMIDSMIADNPGNRDLLRIGAQSYSAYLAAMAECGAESDRLTAIGDKAYLYGKRLCAKVLPVDPPAAEPLLMKQLARLHANQVPDLFWGSLAWLAWIRQQQGAPAAMADLTVIEKIMERLLELDEAYQGGGPHLFFGGYFGAKPAMLGGDPKRSAYHFERALELSGRRFLLVHTTYAETLARQTFNKELHDRVLKEVLAFEIDRAPEFALSNQVAKRIAERLLAEDYFAE